MNSNRFQFQQDLSIKVQQVQEKLATQISADFHNTLMSPSSSSAHPPGDKLSLSQLKDACSVVSVLEDQKVKADLLKWFICKSHFKLSTEKTFFFVKFNFSIYILTFAKFSTSHHNFFFSNDSASITRIRAIIP